MISALHREFRAIETVTRVVLQQVRVSLFGKVFPRGHDEPTDPKVEQPQLSPLLRLSLLRRHYPVILSRRLTRLNFF